METWRQKCRPIIFEVMNNNSNASDKKIKKLLKNEYPFGERSYYPYKAWLLEIKSQLELRKKVSRVKAKMYLPIV